MADIQGKILNKYGINIDQDNLFKLYKIESPDISDAELESKFEMTRKRWEQSVNGANEKNALRDKARLDKADRFEAILSDAKLRREVFDYYNGNTAGNNDKANNGTSSVSGIDFARDFFKLVQTTKRLKQEDVDFFFDYYQSQRKNKKHIYEMLEKEFKIHGLNKKSAESDEEIDIDSLEGKEKDESKLLIVNLFAKETVLKLSKCMQNFDSVRTNSEVLAKYPDISAGVYEFLQLKNIETIEQFRELISNKSKEVYSVRQEKGTVFTPLVDVLNTLQDMSKYVDVVDNFLEFKLLIKYPNLTPYMYEFLDVKNETIKEFYRIANREYAFRDEADFILNYFNPVRDNFNVDASAIGQILRNAERKAKANKILNEIDEKLGKRKNREFPISASIIHWLVYWPIFTLYFVFEVFKTIATQIHKFSIPVFVVMLIASNWLLPKSTEVENILYLRKIFFKEEWLSYLAKYAGSSVGSAFEAVLLSLFVIIITLMIYILPAYFASRFITSMSNGIRQRYDWIGLERTFKFILEQLKQKTKAEYSAKPELFLKRKLSKIIVNFVCLAILCAAIILTPIGFRALGAKNGHVQKGESIEKLFMDEGE